MTTSLVVRNHCTKFGQLSDNTAELPHLFPEAIHILFSRKNSRREAQVDRAWLEVFLKKKTHRDIHRGSMFLLWTKKIIGGIIVKRGMEHKRQKAETLLEIGIKNSILKELSFFKAPLAPLFLAPPLV